MTVTNSPVGKPQEALDNEDSILKSLSNLAYSSVAPESKKKVDVSNMRTSRFWFTLETPQEAVNKVKESMIPKPVEHIDVEVQKRLARYKTEAPVQLHEKIKEVREFFLTQIAPRTLAASGGTIQATEVVQRLLDTDVDPAIMNRFENMINRAATLKLAEFALHYFDLGPEHLESLLGNQHQGDPDMKALLRQLKELPQMSDMKSLVSGELKKMEKTNAQARSSNS